MPIQRFESEIFKIENLTPTVKNFYLTTPEGFEFKAGQFVSLTININGEEVKRAYSIASNPENKHIELCIKKVSGGKATPFIFEMKEGSKVPVLGPTGKFTLENKKDKDIVFISTGTGVAPFRSMIYELLNSNFDKKIILLNGFRYENEILFKNEFEELEEKHQNFSYHVTLTRPSENFQGNIGRMQTLIDKYIKNTNQTFLLCGLNAMIQDVKTFLLVLGVAEENIHFERWD